MFHAGNENWSTGQHTEAPVGTIPVAPAREAAKAERATKMMEECIAGMFIIYLVW
jgi:hypothetical protein